MYRNIIACFRLFLQNENEDIFVKNSFKKFLCLLKFTKVIFANSCILAQTVVLIFFFFSSLTCQSLLFVAVLPDVSASVVPSP